MLALQAFLAWRFIRSSSQKSISIMIKVCFLGISIGTFALALAVAIMNGFEQATRNKMQGVHSDLILHSSRYALNSAKIRSTLLKDYSTSIAEVSPLAKGHALITSTRARDLSSLVMVIGIDPSTYAHISSLGSMVQPSSPLDELVFDTHIIVGHKLAASLALKSNDPVTLFVTSDTEPVKNTLTLDSHEAVLQGTFKTGIDEFDANIIMCSLSLFEELFPEVGIKELGIKLKPGAQESTLIPILKKRLNLDVYSWKELYPALLSTLALEKYAAFFIMALITLVASMNLISLLFMYLTSKKATIAVLKAMGTGDRDIICIFSMIGMAISCCATVAGLMLAYGVSVILEWYPFIKLPDTYYVSHLPAKMDWQIALSVAAIVLILSFISTWFTAQRSQRIAISSLLREPI